MFLSIKLQDDRAFERNYDQLKTYYTDTGCVPSLQYTFANHLQTALIDCLTAPFLARS